jgi:hypothetical protein
MNHFQTPYDVMACSGRIILLIFVRMRNKSAANDRLAVVRSYRPAEFPV